MGVSTTSYKMVEGKVQALRDGIWKELQYVNVPDISDIHSKRDFYSLMDVSSPEAWAESYIDMVDKAFYMYMSKTEVTETVYRSSAWLMHMPVEFVKGIFMM